MRISLCLLVSYLFYFCLKFCEGLTCSFNNYQKKKKKLALMLVIF